MKTATGLVLAASGYRLAAIFTLAALAAVLALAGCGPQAAATPTPAAAPATRATSPAPTLTAAPTRDAPATATAQIATGTARAATARAAQATVAAAATTAARATVAAHATAQIQELFAAARQVFRDEFADNRNNWFVGRFNDRETDAIEDGVFKVKWSGEGTSYELYEVQSFTNFIAQIDCVVYQGTRDGSCGIIFAQKADVGFYKFEVFNDYFRLYIVKKDTEPLLLAEGDPAGIVNPDNTNSLRVIRHNGEIRIYLNERFLATKTDTTYGEGRVGVSTNSYRKEGGVEVWFDNFTIWALP